MKTRMFLLVLFVSSILFGCSSSIVGIDADDNVPQDTVTEVDRNDQLKGL